MISLILMSLAGVCKAIMDTLQFHFATSVFKEANLYFWYPEMSWMNKYKDHNPLLGEKFFGSSSVFVFTTDAWHLFGMIGAFLTVAAIVLYNPITKIKTKPLSILTDFVIIKVTHQVIFHVLFTWVLVHK